MTDSNTKQWTAAQQEAIEKRNCSILVSAAAGSGKTTTLTERIIRRLTDPVDPVSVTELLVVTFTKASAADLKQKIRNAIKERLSLQPNSEALQRQLRLLGTAQISTIHSFCKNLIQSNFQALGLPGNMRMGDETEMKLLEKSVMDELIEDCYENVTTDIKNRFADFDAFCARFYSGKRTDDLTDAFLSIYHTVENQPNGVDWLKQQHAMWEEYAAKGTSFWDTQIGQQSTQWEAERYCYFADRFEYGKELIEKNPDYAAYAPMMAFFAEQAQALSDAFSRHDRQTAGSLLRQPCPIRARKANGAIPTAETEWAEKLRREYKKRKDVTFRRIFSIDADTEKMIAADQSALMRNIAALMEIYDRRLFAKKRTKGVMSFSDLERLALRLLYDPKTDAPTDLGRRVGDKYREIYIDEYQDINPLQDRIFSCIAKPDNLFMVGDIKQSIYSFRGSTPQLFRAYRRQYELEDGAPTAAIFLSENFRCNEHIIGFTNDLFEFLFHISDATPYQQQDRLIHAKRGSREDMQTKVQIHIFDKPVKTDAASEEIKEEDAASEVSLSEAEWTAREIAHLLKEGKKGDGTPLQKKDIAILMRSNKAAAQVYEEALQRYGIASVNQAAPDFFENPEVLLVLSLLHVINNPLKDIYLAAVLKSPLYDFSLDELIAVRQQHPEEITLFDALEAYTAANPFPKGERFLNKLAQYRALASELPVDQLLWQLYCDTGLLGMAYEQGKAVGNGSYADPGQMRANLMMFYEYARHFEHGSFQGLYQFITYITDIIDSKTTLQRANLSNGTPDAVQIITVHKSKGLEFPVCFLSNTGKQFNDQDKKGYFLIEEKLGVTAKYIDPSGCIRIKTPIYENMAETLRRESIEEELRVLYVAMTRAKERLYITGEMANPQQTLKKMAFNGDSPYVFWNCATSLQMILQAAMDSQSPYYELTLHTADETKQPTQTLAQDALHTAEEPTERAPDTEEIFRLLQERMDYVYPYQHAAAIPSKIAVSKLYPGVLDDAAQPIALCVDAAPTGGTYTTEKAVPLPLFMEPQRAQSGALRGTATHVFMQFCDYRQLADSGVECEIERLKKDRFLSATDAQRIRRDWIDAFVHSAVFSQMKAAKRLWREKRFTCRFPAKMLAQDSALRETLAEESVLVQGVIDCFWEEADGIVILDYKTDDFSAQQLENKNDVIQTMLQRHTRQLQYYQFACESMTKKPVRSLQIYSFALGDTIEVPLLPKDPERKR